MNTFKKIAFLLLTCVAIGIFVPSCKSGSEKESTGNGEAVDLKLNFKPGDKFLYSTKIDQKISYTENMSMNQSMLMEMVYAYSGEDNGNKKLSITYDHIIMNMTSPMGNTIYDSRDPKKSESDMNMMGNLIGKTFNISVAPNGEILKVEGLGDIINSLSDSADKSASSEIASQFSDTAVKLMMQNSFDIYPGRTVKVGETWSKKSQMGFSGIKVNVENTYTLKSISGNKATIAVTSIMTLPKTNMGASAGGMEMEMNGKQDGTMDVDISSGQIISGKTTQDIKGTMTGMGQKMPMNIKGDIVISSKRL
jgi:hypothetical protein